MLSNWDNDRNAEQVLFQEDITLCSNKPSPLGVPAVIAKHRWVAIPMYILNIRKAALTSLVTHFLWSLSILAWTMQAVSGCEGLIIEDPELLFACILHAETCSQKFSDCMSSH